MILEMGSRTDLIAHEDNINIQQHLVDVKKKKEPWFATREDLIAQKSQKTSHTSLFFNFTLSISGL